MLAQHAKSWHSQTMLNLLATTCYSNLKCSVEQKEEERETPAGPVEEWLLCASLGSGVFQAFETSDGVSK